MVDSFHFCGIHPGPPGAAPMYAAFFRPGVARMRWRAPGRGEFAVFFQAGRSPDTAEGTRTRQVFCRNVIKI